MKINKLSAIILIIFAFGFKGYSQKYGGKIETGYMKFHFHTIQVDAGLNWKGYNLEDENGIDLNLINGIKFKNKLFAGIGLGYLNFEGINGISVFTDFEYLPLKTKLRPLINSKIGYNHIWNQYENGTGSALVELGLGISYRLSEKLNIYLQSGLLMTQQSLLIPFRIGLGF